MKPNNKHTNVALLVFAAALSVQQAHAEAPFEKTLHCEVAIVGGGPAGVHSLFRLAPVLHSKVCLFEANDYFGGRVKDIPSPNGKGVFGVGALRVTQTQNLMYNLAKELGFDLSRQTGNFEVPYGPQRVFARGQRTENVNSFLLGAPPYATPVPGADFPDPAGGYIAGQYPDASTAWNCEGDSDYNGCYSDAYYHALLNPKYRPAPLQYPDNLSWLKDSNVLKPEGFQYLTDTFRFRGDFQNGIDPLSYIDFLNEDWDVCCNPTYPEGGMSSFVNAMVQRAVQNGAKAFKNEPVKRIDKLGHSRYRLVSPRYKVIADSVIIAVPALPFKKIGGDIASQIQAKPEFQALKPIRVISINNWWKREWWKDTAAADGSGNLDRAWSTKDGVPGEQLCFNFMEFGHSAYHKLQHATRSVYNDDTACSDFWSSLYQSKGIAGINQEIVREFKIVFPEAAAGISVKAIEKTAYQDWPDAWYFLQGPTELTNEAIAVWALEPLKGEKVSLVGDAYNPSRTTWVDGAFKSSINSLNYNYSGNTARIAGYLNHALPCYSVGEVGGKLAYIPFNKDGDFNANCPLQ